MPIPGIIASSQTGGLVTGAFESIATVAGSGSSGTVSFTSIPSGYKALQIRYIGKSTQGGSAARYFHSVTFNGSTSSYAWHILGGNGSAASATGGATQANISTDSTLGVIPNSATALADMHGVGIIDIIDYTSTSKAKTLRGLVGLDMNGNSTSATDLWSGLWYATPAAITQIDLKVGTGSWTTTSSFSLYGIK